MSRASTAPSRQVPTGLIVTAAVAFLLIRALAGGLAALACWFMQVARPDASRTSHAIDRGETDRRFVLEARANQRPGLPWVAVYRRMR